MTKREIAALAFRVLALWVFAQSATGLSIVATGLVSLLSGAFGKMDQPSVLYGIAIGSVPPIVLFAMSAFLWTKADAIAIHLYSDEDTVQPSQGDAPATTDLLAIAFASIGMYILVLAIPEFSSHLAKPLIADVSLREVWADSGWRLIFWTKLLQVALGVWLMIGMRGIARFVKSLQRGAPSDADVVDSNRPDDPAPFA
jgi:hypothetical protein